MLEFLASISSLVFSCKIHGFQEERFRPSRLESEAALNRLVEEMSDLGIDITFAIDMTQTATLHISFHSLQFTKTSVNLAKDLRPLLEFVIFSPKECLFEKMECKLILKVNFARAQLASLADVSYLYFI